MSNFIDILPEEVVGTNISSYLGPRTLQALRSRNEYQEETFQRAAVRDTLEGIDIALETDDADLLYRIAGESKDFEQGAFDRLVKRRTRGAPQVHHERIIKILTRNRERYDIIWTELLSEAFSKEDPNIVQMILTEFNEYIDKPILINSRKLKFLAENRQLIEPLSKIKLRLSLSTEQQYMVLLQLFLDTTNKIPSYIYDDAWNFSLSWINQKVKNRTAMKDILTDEIDDYLRFLLDVRRYVQ